MTERSGHSWTWRTSIRGLVSNRPVTMGRRLADIKSRYATVDLGSCGNGLAANVEQVIRKAGFEGKLANRQRPCWRKCSFRKPSGRASRTRSIAGRSRGGLLVPGSFCLELRRQNRRRLVANGPVLLPLGCIHKKRRPAGVQIGRAAAILAQRPPSSCPTCRSGGRKAVLNTRKSTAFPPGRDRPGAVARLNDRLSERASPYLYRRQTDRPPARCSGTRTTPAPDAARGPPRGQ